MRLRNREAAKDAVAVAQRVLREGDPAAYLACTERAVARFPDDAGVRLEYASALLDSNPERAAREALQAVGLDRTPDAVRLTRAALLLLPLGETDAARSCAERAAAAGPTNVVVVNQIAAVRGEIAAREQDYGSAEKYLRIAHEADPSNALFARDLARVILASDDQDHRATDAMAIIDRTLTLAPNQSHAEREGRRLLEQLRVQVRSGLTDGPVEPVTRLTTQHDEKPRLDPTPAEQGGSPERRVAAPATSAQSRSAAEALLRAQKLLASGKTKQYRSITERAVAAFPKDAAIRVEYATALAPDSPADAISEARRASELEAEDELTRTALLLRGARLMIDLGAPDDAQVLADSAVEGANAHVMLANDLASLQGRIAAAKGELAAAETELRRAHSADPIHSVYALELAEFLLAHQRPGDALDVIEETLATPQRDGLKEIQAGQQLERLSAHIRERHVPLP
jgi:tetratricopeptide (TPR) repeat protein